MIKFSKESKCIKMVQPLLKWVGNKRKVAKQIISYFPEEFNNYYEPFVGSGAVLAELLDEKVTSEFINFNGSYASDNNIYLIEIFNYVKNKPQKIMGYYTQNIENYMDDKVNNYNKIRERFNKNPNGLDFCLLSRTCYGGIIRFRKDGYMSTPVGPHKPISPEKFKQRVNIWHQLIKETEFEALDYKQAMARAKKGDVIYCDPPYTHSQNILYGAQDFNINELWDCIAKAKKRGVKVLVSINGKRKSGSEDISVTPPANLFERILNIDTGISMVNRLQNSGKHMKKSRVTDQLMLTY